MNRDLQNLRQDYKLGALMEDQIPGAPFSLFSTWFDQAQFSGILEPNAMTIATVNADGKPSARIVLLKGLSEEGFIFYTNYNSRKGQDIEANPFVSVVFLWKELQRQVRIEGSISKLSAEQSEKYYHSRPKGSQIGAWASPQSQVIQNRSILDNEYERVEAQYENQEQLPKPPNWGGYILQPSMVEFWQGRSSRMHDRIRYQFMESTWKIDRLAP